MSKNDSNSAGLQVAVFDLDGTIIQRTSAERQLAGFLVRQKKIGIIQAALFGGEFIRLALTGRWREFRKNRRYLAGLKVDNLRKLLPDMCETRLCPLFADPVIQRLGEATRLGMTTVLLSGAPSILLACLNRHLRMKVCIGAEIESHNGTFTGRILEPYPYGEGKIRAFERRFAADTIDYGASYAYADRASDIPFLERFGHPVAVQPDAKLLAHARREKWEIIFHSSPKEE